MCTRILSGVFCSFHEYISIISEHQPCFPLAHLEIEVRNPGFTQVEDYRESLGCWGWPCSADKGSSYLNYTQFQFLWRGWLPILGGKVHSRLNELQWTEEYGQRPWLLLLGKSLEHKAWKAGWGSAMKKIGKYLKYFDLERASSCDSGWSWTLHLPEFHDFWDFRSLPLYPATWVISCMWMCACACMYIYAHVWLLL